LLGLIQESLDDDQAADVVTIDLRGKTSLADYMLIASGRSARHVAAVAEHLGENLRKSGHRHFQIEGLPAADWVLIDAGDVIVHLFRPEVRSFYNLERMWSPALIEELETAS
jgi:ribosome-associated protein